MGLLSTLFPNSEPKLTRPLIAEKIPLNDISGSVMLFSDGSLSAGFSCRAPITGDLPEDERARLFNSLRSALLVLPDDVNVQFYFGQESRAGDVAKLFEEETPNDSLASIAFRARANRIVEEFKKSNLRTTTLDIFISIPPIVTSKELNRRVGLLDKELLAQQGHESRDSKIGQILDSVTSTLDGLFTPLKGATVLTYDEYHQGREKLVSASNVIRSALLGSGLEPKLLTSDELLNRYYRRWNPRKYEIGLLPRPYSPSGNVPLVEHILTSPIDFDAAPKSGNARGLVYLDGYYHRIVTLTMPPEELNFPQLEDSVLFGGILKMDVIVNITQTPVTARIKALQDEENAIINNNKEKTNAQKLTEIRQQLAALGSGEEKLWEAQHIFILRDEDPKVLKRQVEELFTSLKKANIDLCQEDFATFDYWMASQPGYSRHQDLFRHNKYDTQQLITMLPAFGAGGIRQGARIGAIFDSGSRSIYNLNPLDTMEMTSPNAIIIGNSGSGKSVLVNSIITALARNNPRVIIVDIGASYKNLCESFGGAFIEYDIRTTECRINPFDIFSKGWAEPDELGTVMLLLQKLVADPKHGPILSSEERVAFEDALASLIDKHRQNTFYLNDLREFLAGQSSKTSQDLARRLSVFCRGGGSYANMFDGPTEAPITSRFIVFELQKIRYSNPELLPIVFQVVLQHSVAMAHHYPEDTRVLTMDEAHVLLEDPVLRNFVSLVYRTFRKLGVISLGCSQGIDDWIIPGAERAILDNISGLYVCPLKAGGPERVAKAFQLSDNELAAISGLQFVPGVVSQFGAFTFGAGGRRLSICNNTLSDIEYAMFTTNADDRRALDKLKEEGYSIAERIKRFAELYPRGVQFSSTHKVKREEA